MPRGRIVLKSICQSKKLADLKTDSARLLYTWLLPNVDINGCYSADPEVLKGQILTRLKKTNKQITEYIEDMRRVGLIVVYNVSKDLYLQIPDFQEKQPNLNSNKEAEPVIPLPTPEQLQSNSRLTLDELQRNSALSLSLSLSLSKDKDKDKDKDKEKEKEKEKVFFVFEAARKLYPGTKRGLNTELNDYKKKHADWKACLPLLKPAVEREIVHKKNLKNRGEFCPPWAHFKTWLSQRRWEMQWQLQEQGRTPEDDERIGREAEEAYKRQQEFEAMEKKSGKCR